MTTKLNIKTENINYALYDLTSGGRSHLRDDHAVLSFDVRDNPDFPSWLYYPIFNEEETNIDWHFLFRVMLIGHFGKSDKESNEIANKLCTSKIDADRLTGFESEETEKLKEYYLHSLNIDEICHTDFARKVVRSYLCLGGLPFIKGYVSNIIENSLRAKIAYFCVSNNLDIVLGFAFENKGDSFVRAEFIGGNEIYNPFYIKDIKLDMLEHGIFFDVYFDALGIVSKSVELFDFADTLGSLIDGILENRFIVKKSKK